MDLTKTTALVTGSNRGMGRQIVKCLIAAGVPKIYATARDPAKIADLVDGTRVESFALDVTVPDQVAAAAARCTDIGLLINNAGVNRNRPMIGEPEALANARAEMEVNYFGMLSMCRAFAPVLAANGGGMIVAMLSLLARVCIPAIGTYSASKAAGLSLVQGVRAELAGQGTHVLAVMPGSVDTDMTPGGLAKPEDIAASVIEAIGADVEDLYPDAMALDIIESLARDAKALEKELAAYVLE